MAQAPRGFAGFHDVAVRLGLRGAKRSLTWIWMLLLVLAVVLLLVHNALSSQASTLELEQADDMEGQEEVIEELPPIIVDVTGAVISPGVYELKGDARIIDCIEAAGGAEDDAYLPALNLASFVQDGMQVYVPTLEELEEGESTFVLTGSQDTASDTDGKININTAGLGELETLSGIGPSLAQRIIDDRDLNGPFPNIEDLQRVSGIGEKKYAAIADSICV